MKVRIVLAVTLALLSSSAFAQQIRLTDFTRDGDSMVKDPDAPVSFQLPQGWKLVGGFRWGDHETTLRLADTQSGVAVSF